MLTFSIFFACVFCCFRFIRTRCLAPGDVFCPTVSRTAARDNRRRRMDRLRRSHSLVADLVVEMPDEHNPLVPQFRFARDCLLSPTCPDISIRLFGSVASHGDRYSLPVVPELAGLLVGGLTREVNRFDVVVETKSGTCRQVYPLNPSLMSLQCPLLFPYGDAGFHSGIEMRVVDRARPPTRENISMTEYY
jgi:hypothetical protein